MKKKQDQKQREINLFKNYITDILFDIVICKNDIISVFNADGKLIYSSSPSILGYSIEEINNIELYSLIHPADLPLINDSLDDLFVTFGKQVMYTLRLHHNDGSWRWYEITAKVIIKSEGIPEIVSIAHDVTNLHHISLKNQKDYNQIRKIVDQSLDVMCVFDQEGKFVYVSNSCKNIWGFQPEDLIGKSYMNLIPKDDRKATAEATKNLISGIDLINFENHYIHKDKTLVPISWNAHYDQSEQKIFGVARDISLKVKLDEKLKQSERRFRTLIQNSTDGLMLLDIKGYILDVSDAGKRILEYQNDDKKIRFRTNIHKDDLHEINEAFFDVVNDPDHVKRIEYRYKLPNGDYKWIGASFQNQMHEPAIQAIVQNFRDITESKVAEIAIAKSEALRRSIMNSSLDSIICINLEGEVVLWNNQAEKTFGWKRDEVLGTQLKELIVPDAYKEKYHLALKKFSRGAKSEMFNRIIEITALNRERKEFPIELTIVPVEQDEMFIFCAFIRDISLRKKNEAEREMLTRKAEQRAEELAISNSELEQFAYIASHDLQEPLRMITSFLTQLEKKYKNQLDEKAQQYIHFATDGAIRMRRIILDLLEYSRVGRRVYEKEALDVESLLEEVVQFHRLSIREKDASIVWRDIPKTIIAAKTPMEQLFQNLIANAIKYQPPGNKPEIEISAKEYEQFWEFAVKDNGIGIEPGYFDKIFVLFQRLHNKDEFSGTGIGLAICKKIVENFNGKIWLESSKGKGSTFYFTIKK